MYINIENVPELLGIDGHLGEEILQALFEFTLVFSLTEHRLMNRKGSIHRTHIYAKDLVENHGMRADNEFHYFHHRYILGDDAARKLDILCNEIKPDREAVYAALVKPDPSDFDKVNAVLKVCLRLRHNLFHGNKWQYNLRDQEHNLDTATRFFSRYLNSQR